MKQIDIHHISPLNCWNLPRMKRKLTSHLPKVKRKPIIFYFHLKSCADITNYKKQSP